ncbi:calcium-binding and coiled-coil domain-containing protein 1-like [Watersipora subatra]|uniref:calcium-binding and coiled-coil domain-containing protein 1-like n=1 Tax=Watersipora subatra TaxID=2589382 RepID=UPI00355C073B
MAEFRDQVSFTGVAKSYPTDAHVECRYKMKPTHEYTAYDWIGLFKVGWSNQKEFQFYHWVPSPNDRNPEEEYEHSILYQSVYLPKEDGEYYQFVYFNGKGKMCGTSSPFYFHQPRHEEFVEEVMQDDADMLYITTKRGQLEEKKQECDKLAKTCEAMNQEIESLAEQLKEAQKLREDLSSENTQLREATSASELEKEREIVGKVKQIEELTVEVARLKNEVETLKTEQDQLLEQINLVENNAAKEVEGLKKNLDEALPLKEAIETMEAQLSSCHETIDSLKQAMQQQQEEGNGLRDKLSATEERHAVDLTEIASLKETLDNLSSKIEEVNNTNEELKSKLAKVTSLYDTEKNDWSATLDKMDKEKNSLLSTIGELQHRLEQVQAQTVSAESYDIQEDRYIALQTAYSLLKEELREQQKTLAAQTKREQKHRAVTAVQVEELKGKIKESQEEYTKLGTQKIKLEKRLSKMKTGMLGKDRETSPLNKRSSSGVSRDHLSKEELIHHLERVCSEVDSLTVKKDRYKEKYLEEKQRAATLRDYHKSEADKLKTELAIVKEQLRAQAPAPTPIVYPELSASGANKHGKPAQKKKQHASSGSGDAPSKGVLEQSIHDDTTSKLTPLPAPLEPVRAQRERKEANAPLMYTSNPRHSSVLHPSTIIYPEQRKLREEVVMPMQSDSEDENEGNDRFHDAFDVPASNMIKCFICDKVFDIKDSEETRNAHACEHLDGSTVVPAASVDFYHCPICNQQFDKRTLSIDDMQAHVNAHFTQPN